MSDQPLGLEVPDGTIARRNARSVARHDLPGDRPVVRRPLGTVYSQYRRATEKLEALVARVR